MKQQVEDVDTQAGTNDSSKRKRLKKTVEDTPEAAKASGSIVIAHGSVLKYVKFVMAHAIMHRVACPMHAANYSQHCMPPLPFKQAQHELEDALMDDVAAAPAGADGKVNVAATVPKHKEDLH